MTPIDALSAPRAADRLSALRAMPIPDTPLSGVYVNNHIHTIYSFSPYSPACAVYKAREAGLPTAGIMDHDSVSGAAEFAEAGAILGIATTAGAECRVSLAATPFAGRRVNNPDQAGNIYISMHGIPKSRLPAVEAVLAPLRRARNRRNRAMIERLNAMISPIEISLDFDRDVLPLSRWEEGGSVTERHICYAAARALVAVHGRSGAAGALARIGAIPSGRVAGWLADPENHFFEYDILGLLKSQLVPRFYLPAEEECLPVGEIIELSHDIGAIAAYPYLGDVGDSATGDKAAQRFEDGFLEELFDYLRLLRVEAVTYMPSRNTVEQLNRVQRLCRERGFFEISGEDINAPRQSFVCPALARPEFAHLRASAWALIGHEKAAESGERGMFSPWALQTHPELTRRIEVYAGIGQEGCRISPARV